jgi:hypothetical protein
MAPRFQRKLERGVVLLADLYFASCERGFERDACVLTVDHEAATVFTLK